MSGQGPWIFATMPVLVTRLVSVRAQLVAVALAVVMMVMASACGGSGAGGGGRKVAKPVVTPKQAVAVVKTLDGQRVKAIDAGDGAALSGIETEPQLTYDQDGIQTIKDQGNTAEYPSDVSVTPLVPKQTAYPAWFMAIVHVSNGQTALDLFTRESRGKRWQVTAVTRLYGAPVQWKQVSGGWAVSAGLNVDPSRTLSDYWNAAVSGTSTAGAGVAPGTMTSDIASQIESKISDNKSRGWTQTAGFAAGGTLPEAVELTNGASLSFAWVIEELKTWNAYPYCFPQPASNGSKWDPLVPNGSYREIDLTYTYMEGMVTPSSGTIEAVSYATGTTGVNATPCSS